VEFKVWVGVWGTMLGAFMAVLDIQVTNASLRYITGVSVVTDSVHSLPRAVDPGLKWAKAGARRSERTPACFPQSSLFFAFASRGRTLLVALYRKG
jgi:hypothetical protein